MAAATHSHNYPFLSKPPPPQKKRPSQPLPPTPTFPRSTTFSAIAAWAAHVQPGSPGSPNSPHRRPSLTRRSSTSSRRLSISLSLTPSPRATANSFLLVDTPTPSSKDFTIDLTDLGYTSVFVHLPKTPTTPAVYLQTKQPQMPTNVNPDSFPMPPSPTRRPPPLKRFRSLSILRNRNRSTKSTLPPSPTKSVRIAKSTTRQPPRSPTKSESPQILAATVAKRKKAIYAYAKSSKATKPKPKHAPLPPSLASELALMQFADGGSTDANIKRLMEARARAAAPAGTAKGNAALLPMGDVYRDEKGGVWWDREEEMEYVHLLGGRTAGVEGVEKWVAFGGDVKEGVEAEGQDELALANLAGLGRRDSSTSTNSANSTLDPSNIVKPAEEDAAFVTVPESIPVPALAPPRARRGSPPLITIPSRPRARPQHLHANPGFFLLDLQAFTVPSTPRTPRTPRTPATPYSPRTPAAATTATNISPSRRLRLKNSLSPIRPSFNTRTHIRPRGAARRRPAPLTLVAHRPVRSIDHDEDRDVQMVAVDVNVDVDAARRAFLGDSFAPTPPMSAPVLPRVLREAVPVSTAASGMKKKASRLDLKLGGLFGRK